MVLEKFPEGVGDGLSKDLHIQVHRSQGLMDQSSGSRILKICPLKGPFIIPLFFYDLDAFPVV